MRLFLAINLPPAMRRALVEATGPMHTLAPDVRWISEAKLHLTMKFLGEVDASRLDEIGATVGAVAARHAATDVTVSGLGAFPNSRRPRVLWIGAERSSRLELLAHDLEQACETLGFEAEGRAFRPHITLGRIRDRLGVEQARALARAGRRIGFEDTLLVSSIDLMCSVPGGRSYDLMSSASLSRQEL